MQFIQLIVLVFLIIKVVALNDTQRKHERWIKTLRDQNLSLKEELAKVTRADNELEEAIETQVEPEEQVDQASIQVSTLDPTQAEVTAIDQSTSDQTEQTDLIKNESFDEKYKRKRAKKRKPIFDKNLLSVEFIISKLGMALLLIGIGFLFKLAYDKGMITEHITIVIGFIIGLVFYYSGFKVKAKERLILSQVLFGGGIATYYITTYAAYLAYGMLNDTMAFLILILITVWAFTIAMMTNSPSISVIAVLGGLLIPFVVELDFIGIFGIGMYILALSIGSMCIYTIRQWRVLQIATIVSVYISTILLLYGSELTGSEPIHFSGLIFSLLVVFSIPDVHLHISRREAPDSERLSAFIIGIVPVVSILHFEYIDVFTDSVQAIIYGAMFALYALTTYYVVKERGISILTNVLISLTGLFSTFALILYFGGVVRVISIIVLGVLFYFISHKTDYNFTRIVGHVIFFSGYLGALFNLVEVFFEAPEVSDIVTRLSIVVLLTVGLLYQKGKIRHVIGVMIYQVYSLILLESILYHMMSETNVIAASIFVVSIWLIVLQVLKDRFNFLPQYSIMAYGFTFMLFKVMLSVYHLWIWDAPVLESIAFLCLSATLYLLAHRRHETVKQRYLMKMMSFATVFMVVLFDGWILTDYSQYGVAIAGGLLFAIITFEQDKDEIFTKTWRILSYGWIILLGMTNLISIYGFSYENQFEWLRLMNSIVQLAILYVLQRTLPLSDKIKFVGYSLLYMLLSNNSLSALSNGNGTITLVWAAYALSMLTYHMIMARRELANYSLVLIVIVAVKFILVDLSTVSVLWKIITSMIFGTALLVISYWLQPIMLKFDKNRKT